MKISKMIRISVKGVPVLPLLLMGIVTVGAVVVAGRSVSNTLTINSAFSIQLFTFTGGVCTTTVFSSYAFPTQPGQTVATLDSSMFCIKNTSNNAVWIGGSQAYSIGAGFPAGSTVTIVNGAADLKSVTSFSLASGASYFGTAGLDIRITLAGTEAAGSYSWSSTVNAFDVSTP